jgi:PAT family acetyl-CoA transporter-like MFS transporter 1
MSIKSDLNSIIWLLVLYTLQGVPLGMSAVFPLLLKEQGASYSDLARFSLCSWPFALKLLWAPLVDGSNLPFIGRRKSWLVPSQILIGSILWYLSGVYQDLLKSDINQLTLIFFLLYFLAATQDIAVDGWALTMLSKANVGYAGTCNSVGQTAGYFLAFSGFFGLSKLGVCTLEQFMQVWAILFVVVTILVAILKVENDLNDLSDESISRIYSQMVSVLNLSSVRQLCLILLTCGIPFIDGLLGVKFQDAGVSSEVIALIATLTTPVHIVLPWLVSKYSSKSTPMKSFRWVFPVRIFFQLLSVFLIELTPYALTTTDPIMLYTFYAICVTLSMVESGVMQIMFVSKMTFFAKISDPVIGGTFMTVLNTVSNIGGNIANQVSYRLAEASTIEGLVDGFYVVVVFATIYGIVWLKIFGNRLIQLERRPESAWRVVNRGKVV